MLPELNVELDALLPGRIQTTVAEDVNSTLKRKDIKPTTKLALVAARVGQGKFREDVLQLWGQRFAVTHSTTRDAIRASHIIPWCESTDVERLDPNNGIPLIAKWTRIGLCVATFARTWADQRKTHVLANVAT